MRIKLAYWNLGPNKSMGEAIIEGKDWEEINSKVREEFKKFLITSSITFEQSVVYAAFKPAGRYNILELK